MYRIAVDTGGTFTDVVVADAQGRIHVAKALTTCAPPQGVGLARTEPA